MVLLRTVFEILNSYHTLPDSIGTLHYYSIHTDQPEVYATARYNRAIYVFVLEPPTRSQLHRYHLAGNNGAPYS